MLAKLTLEKIFLNDLDKFEIENKRTNNRKESKRRSNE
tara:strand:+ start:870 stop:983 length:114 start_codon:yes stop_codon:yes gene_type:complete